MSKKYPGVFEDKDGTFLIKPRIKDVYGKVHMTTLRGFKTQKEAFEKKIELQNTKRIITNTRISFKKIFYECIDYNLKKGKISKGTYNTYVRRNEKNTLPIIGEINIFDFTVDIYKKLQDKLIKKGLAIGTINGLHSDIVATLKYAILFYDLKYNVAEMVGPIYESRDEINNFITLQDMESIGKAESVNDYEWEHFMHILEEKVLKCNDEEEKMLIIKDILFFSCEFVLMMRIGEVQALTYEDILYDMKKIFLNKSYSKDAKEIVPLKNRTTRFIYPTVKILELFKLCEEYDKTFAEFKRTNFIFGHTNYFSRTNVMRRLKKIQEQINPDKNLTNHKLRHGGISNMLYQRIDPTIVAEVSGHNKEMTMNVYNQSVSSAKHDLVNKLDTLYTPHFDHILTTKNQNH